MVGFDFRYQQKALQARGELFYSTFTNTTEYNAFTGRDIGSSMFGYYGEIGYDISTFFNWNKSLVPFLRYSQFNTHQSITPEMTVNKAYDRTVITSGISYFLNSSFVVKLDYQNFKNANNQVNHSINSGIGFWFR